MDFCFYMHYFAHWSEYIQVAESPSGEIMDYSKSIQFKHVLIIMCNSLM